MTEEHEGLETELESLFDDTAHVPDTHGLTRMAARAQDVPAPNSIVNFKFSCWARTGGI